MNESILAVVKEDNFNNPNFDEVDYLLDNVFRDCKKKYFHTFEYTLVYDINFTNFSNNEEVNFTTTHRSMEFKTELFGLYKKKQNCLQKSFIFNQKNKLT